MDVKGMTEMYDVIIIGAGVSGAACAKELSKYQVKACVLERAEDVCSGTSKANSAIVHAGYDAEPGTLMAKLNREGNLMMPQLAKELDIPYNPCGSFVVCIDEDSLPNLYDLYERGIANGIEGLEVITDKVRIFEMEPNLADETVAVLYAPTAGIICPFTLNIAMAENANVNGVDFKFNTEVTNIVKIEDGWSIETNSGLYEAKCVVNAAGVYSDAVHNMVTEDKMSIVARRGDYCLLDKNAGSHVKHTIFALPSKYGKGVLVSPTVHGNLLVGPTAIDIDDKENIGTTREGIDQLISKACLNVKDIPMRQVITSFAGLRAHEARHEFFINEVEGASGFIDCAAIESPGLTSCPAIGKMVADMVQVKLDLQKDENYVGTRNGILNPETLDKEARAELIRENPAYGNIICRCEMISEGEILDAIHRPLGARSLDAVKRRTRAGMGRCQGGFCSPRTMEIIHRECGIPMTEITKFGGNSKIVVGTNKDSI